MSDPAPEIIAKTTQDLVTFGLAVLGAGFGIVNFWRDISRDRMRLRVSPRWYTHTDNFRDGICVQIVNLSLFPVYVSRIGFLTSTEKKDFIMPDMFFLHDERLPHCLESRASLTAYFPAGAHQNAIFGSVTAAFAETACGKTFKASGRGQAL